MSSYQPSMPTTLNIILEQHYKYVEPPTWSSLVIYPLYPVKFPCLLVKFYSSFHNYTRFRSKPLVCTQHRMVHNHAWENSIDTDPIAHVCMYRYIYIYMVHICTCYMLVPGISIFPFLWLGFSNNIGDIQSRAEVRAIFLNVDKPLAEKSPRPGHSRVTAIHQNTRGLPSFEGYKVPL